MIDARHYEVHDTLRNGTAVTIRAIRPDDQVRLGAAFSQLEPGSIYTRFFHRKWELTDAELTAATDVDFEWVVALVVTTGSGQDEIVISVGRYVRLDPPGSVPGTEVAFVTEEDYQRLGLASRLLRHLAQIARAKGISRFEAGLVLMVMAVWTVVQVLAVRLLEEVLTGHAHQPETWPVCSSGGRRLQSKGFRERVLHTLFGVIRWRWRVGRCPHGWAGSQAAPLELPRTSSV